MAHNEKSHSSNKDQEKVDEEIRRRLKVKFDLEGSVFPDNKIFGVIDIEPEWAWQLIKQFTFILNGSRKVKFHSQYRTISVSGFNPSERNLSAVIEAEFGTDKWTESVKSDPRSFYFFDYVFALSPIVSFDWSDNKDSPTLVIKWRHIDDEKAHEYALYLNDKEIYHIHHQLISNEFTIRIQNLICDRKYTLQIAAKLINGKETCRSDPIEFMMPTEKLEDHKDGILSVLNEQLPHDLPIIIEENQGEEDKNETKPVVKKSYLKEEYLLNALRLQIERRINSSQTAGCHYLPHKTFLGIEHYLTDGVNIINKSPSSNLPRKTTNLTLAVKTAPMNNNND